MQRNADRVQNHPQRCRRGPPKAVQTALRQALGCFVSHWESCGEPAERPVGRVAQRYPDGAAIWPWGPPQRGRSPYRPRPGWGSKGALRGGVGLRKAQMRLLSIFAQAGSGSGLGEWFLRVVSAQGAVGCARGVWARPASATLARHEPDQPPEPAIARRTRFGPRRARFAEWIDAAPSRRASSRQPPHRAQAHE